MEKAGLKRSMSKKGCTPDNAACEGFFGRLKNELFHDRSWIRVSIVEFMNILDGYMVWYDGKMIKLSLGAMSPLEYRQCLGLAPKLFKKSPHPHLCVLRCSRSWISGSHLPTAQTIRHVLELKWRQCYYRFTLQFA